MQLKPLIVAIVTPMQPDGLVDYKAFGELIEYQISKGVEGIVVGGTTGESSSLTDEEFVKLLKLAKTKQQTLSFQLIAGTGSHATQQTINKTLSAEKIGVDAALVVTPYYVKPSQTGLAKHYQAIAAASQLPIILYNVPGRTACDLLPATVAELARVKNIIGIKEAASDVERLLALKQQCPADFQLFSGDDMTSLDFLCNGGNGVISVTANVAPGLMAKMVNLALNDQHDEAAVCNKRLLALHDKLFIEANPIPVKWALAHLGLIVDSIRLPLTSLAKPYHAEIKAALAEADIYADSTMPLES